MKLIYETTGKPVEIGDAVNIRGESCPLIVAHIQEPHKPASTGRVYVTATGGGGWREYFPSVIGARWIGRTDGGCYA
jgi:hypothetical protein